MYLEKFSITGKRALVTGAARGIGAAISEALAEGGAHVILTDMGDAAEAAGFKIERTVVEAEGLCPQCQPEGAE